ncbi:MAG TPA: cupin domain-containing protein [Candidatus Dormibacteraeota bacterium]
MTESATETTAAAFVHSAVTTDLEADWGPLVEAVGQQMDTRGTQLWTDGSADCGIWESTPGPSRWEMDQHEMITILSGRMTVTADDGTTTELGPGDCAFFPRGWKGNWLITETIRKAYALF